MSSSIDQGENCWQWFRNNDCREEKLNLNLDQITRVTLSLLKNLIRPTLKDDISATNRTEFDREHTRWIAHVFVSRIKRENCWQWFRNNDSRDEKLNLNLDQIARVTLILRKNLIRPTLKDDISATNRPNMTEAYSNLTEAYSLGSSCLRLSIKGLIENWIAQWSSSNNDCREEKLNCWQWFRNNDSRDEKLNLNLDQIARVTLSLLKNLIRPTLKDDISATNRPNLTEAYSLDSSCLRLSIKVKTVDNGSVKIW